VAPGVSGGFFLFPELLFARSRVARCALKVVSGGGSSHQLLFIVHGAKTRIRAISPREAARLMGLPNSYILPVDPIEALDLCGDGVCMAVVRFLAKWLIEPLLETSTSRASIGPRTAVSVEARNDTGDAKRGF
jgi:hypothetical protein